MTAPDRIDELFSGLGIPSIGDDEVPGKRPRRTAPQTGTQADSEWDAKPTMKMLRGVATEFFTVGDLAAALGRKPVTIRSWEDKRWLPPSPYRTVNPKGTQVPDKKPAGRRMYTRAQITAVVRAAHACGVMTDGGRAADWRSFTDMVVRAWRAES